MSKAQRLAAGEVKEMETGRLARPGFDGGRKRQTSSREDSAVEGFVVDATHVDAILSVAMHGPADLDRRLFPGWDRPGVGELIGSPCVKLSTENATEVGAALLTGSIASVVHSRGMSQPSGAASCSDPGSYEFRDLGAVLTIAECLKALACLECRSCGDSRWRDSPVREFCGSLLWRLISALPGYQDAPWEISAEALIARIATQAA
jgi:hypothetical protein